MPAPLRIERYVHIETARHLVDAALLGCLVAAMAALFLSGFPLWSLGLVVVGTVTVEYLVSKATRRRIIRSAEASDVEADDEVQRLVAELSSKMGVRTPRIVITDTVGAGVSVLQDSSGPVLVVSRQLLQRLDGATLRGVIAHELAHLQLGHLDRFDLRDPIAHVVGVAVLWVAILQHIDPLLALVAVGSYLGASVFRQSAPSQLYYLFASLGVVLLPLGLAALVHRLEEHRADDVAIGQSSPIDFFRGLVRVETLPDGSDSQQNDIFGPVPSREHRGFVDRITATHPPLGRRLERHDVAVTDLQ